MKYLLDTHTLLWVLMSKDKLSVKVKRLLSKTGPEIFTSTISLWEISLKYSLGKLKLDKKKPDEVPNALESMGFDILDLSPEIVSTFYKLPILHKDPFDRMLIWQAIKGNYTLISKDKSISDYEKYGLSLVW